MQITQNKTISSHPRITEKRDSQAISTTQRTPFYVGRSRDFSEAKGDSGPRSGSFQSTLKAIEEAYELPQSDTPKDEGTTRKASPPVNSAVVEQSKLVASQGSTRSMLDLGEGTIGVTTLSQEKLSQKTNREREQVKLKRSAVIQRSYQKAHSQLVSQEISSEQDLKDSEDRAARHHRRYWQTSQAYTRSLVFAHPLLEGQKTPNRTDLKEASDRMSALQERALADWSASEEKVKLAQVRLQRVRESKLEASLGLDQLSINHRLLKPNLTRSHQNIRRLEREQSHHFTPRTILLRELDQG